jgi:hypothetical protein
MQAVKIKNFKSLCFYWYLSLQDFNNIVLQGRVLKPEVSTTKSILLFKIRAEQDFNKP